jgi:hypothetical protein
MYQNTLHPADAAPADVTAAVTAAAQMEEQVVKAAVTAAAQMEEHIGEATATADLIAAAETSGGSWALATTLGCSAGAEPTMCGSHSSACSSRIETGISFSAGLSYQVQPTPVVAGAAQHSPYKDSVL